MNVAVITLRKHKGYLMAKFESHALDLQDGDRKVSLKGSGFTGADTVVHLLDADGRKKYEDTYNSRSVIINATETVKLNPAKPDTIWNITQEGKYAVVWNASEMTDLKMDLLPVEAEEK